MESLSQWVGCPTQLPLHPWAWHRSSKSTFLPQRSSLPGYLQATPFQLPCIFSVAKLRLKIHPIPQLYERKRPFFTQAYFHSDSRSQVKVQTHLHGSEGWMTMNASHSRLPEAPACPQTSSLRVPSGLVLRLPLVPHQDAVCQEGDPSLALHCSEH